MDMNEAFKMLEQRERRVADLQARLDAVKEAEKQIAREITASLNGASPKPASRSRKRSATNEILDASYEILRAAESHELPMHVAEICSRLEAQSIYVGGKNPAGNLSAKLGRDERFRSEGRGGGGWSLTTTDPTGSVGMAHSDLSSQAESLSQLMQRVRNGGTVA